MADSVYQFEEKSISGEVIPLSSYEGKVLLIVNTASECGYTPQYKGLQELYEEYQDEGLVILGLPANNFGDRKSTRLNSSHVAVSHALCRLQKKAQAHA